MDLQKSLALRAMTLLGVGQLLACLGLGKVIDLIGSRRLVLLNLLLIAATMAVTLITLRKPSFGTLSYLMCFIWGFCDATVQTHTM